MLCILYLFHTKIPRDSQDTSMELVHTNGLDSLNMETTKSYMQAHDITLKWMKIKDQYF